MVDDIMKAEVRFFAKGFASATVPEIPELREEIEVATRDELIELAKGVELPAAAEYAHIYVNGEPVIAITRDGIRDLNNEEWIGELI